MDKQMIEFRKLTEETIDSLMQLGYSRSGAQKQVRVWIKEHFKKGAK